MKKDYEFKIFCQNLKTIRKQKSISKKEIAKKPGIGVKALSLIEKGIMPPRLSSCILIMIYNEFGFLPSEIFAHKEKSPGFSLDFLLKYSI